MEVKIWSVLLGRPAMLGPRIAPGRMVASFVWSWAPMISQARRSALSFEIWYFVTQRLLSSVQKSSFTAGFGSFLSG